MRNLKKTNQTVRIGNNRYNDLLIMNYLSYYPSESKKKARKKEGSLKKGAKKGRVQKSAKKGDCNFGWNMRGSIHKY